MTATRIDLAFPQPDDQRAADDRLGIKPGVVSAAAAPVAAQALTAPATARAVPTSRTAQIRGH